MNLLETIVEQKRVEIARLPSAPVTPDDLKSRLTARSGHRDFRAALAQPPAGDIALIAEIKKASPSAGVIRADFDPVRIARDYEAAGASCLSVLTDEHFFQGSLGSLKAIRDAVRLPLLRKDFIIDPRQIPESIDAGADAILLIVAILDDTQLKTLHDLATGCGLAVLVEVHNETELDRAMAIGAPLIGVNNRDLKTFKTDLATTERLAGKLFPAGASSGIAADNSPFLVAESGIHHREDVLRLKGCGARAILVGESLMREAEISPKVRALLGIPSR